MTTDESALLHERYWRFYTLDTSEAEAKELFFKRVGVWPERTDLIDKGVRFVGPVPEKKE